MPKKAYLLLPQQYPEFFKKTTSEVNVITAERTFWEKATILHQQAMRGSISQRHSRHYYDLAQMANSEIKSNALKNIGLLGDVVFFKQQFYPSKSAMYELASPGTLKLVPLSDDLIKELADDYKKMQEMIFADPPSFDSIMDTLRQLENEINKV